MPSSDAGYSSDGSMCSMYNDYSELKISSLGPLPRPHPSVALSPHQVVIPRMALSPPARPGLIQSSIPRPKRSRILSLLGLVPSTLPSPVGPIPAPETETIPNHPTPPGRGRKPAPEPEPVHNPTPATQPVPNPAVSPSPNLPPFLSVSPIPGLLQRPSPPQGLLQSLRLLL
ncbi:hypothetical protein BJV78DRAFT_1198308, partial [Lactifluus subvellereus]